MRSKEKYDKMKLLQSVNLLDHPDLSEDLRKELLSELTKDGEVELLKFSVTPGDSNPSADQMAREMIKSLKVERELGPEEIQRRSDAFLEADRKMCEAQRKKNKKWREKFLLDI